jgi:hypothetical protein
VNEKDATITGTNAGALRKTGLFVEVISVAE